jgi:hypothetical protein
MPAIREWQRRIVASTQRFVHSSLSHVMQLSAIITLTFAAILSVSTDIASAGGVGSAYGNYQTPIDASTYVQAAPKRQFRSPQPKTIAVANNEFDVPVQKRPGLLSRLFGPRKAAFLKNSPQEAQLARRSKQPKYYDPFTIAPERNI